jgi:hypothetical protein
MPTTVEAVLILLVLIAPGFIAMQVRNRLTSYRLPSPFQETVQAVILSTIMLPLWLIGGYLPRAREQFLIDWHRQAYLPSWSVVIPLVAICLVYFVVAPLVGITYTLIQLKRPHVAFGRWILRRFNINIPSGEGPEIWDEVFGRRDTAPWVRVWFKDGSGIEGIVKHVGVSPASRQLYVVEDSEIPNSLVRLDSHGHTLEDLSAINAEGVWIDIGSEVQRVEVFP